MRRNPVQPPSEQKRPIVGVIVDGVTRYGRGVARGVLRFANLQRRWILHEDLWRTVESPGYWPDCDGIIFAGVPPETVVHKARLIVACSGSIDPKEMPVVSLDDHAAGTMAAQHLIECRVGRFAFYGLAKRRTVAQRRMNGFREHLKAQGLDCLECPVEWPTVNELMTHKHRPALRQWLLSLPKPIGIFCADDSTAHDLSSACLESGIDVPDKVAIIGVNNDDLLCEGAWPPLSSVEADYSRVGYLAATMLDRMLKGEKLKPGERHIRVPPQGVVQRASTNVLAVDDADLADAIRYIRDHACDPCSVSDILRHVPVSRRQLERVFRQKLGRTPHDEITRVRMETAQRLLLELNLTIPSIAERCGFSAVQNLTRVFGEYTGTTPGAWRRKALAGSQPA